MRNKLKWMFTTFLALSLMLPATLLMSPTIGAKADADFIQPDVTGLYGGLIHWVEVIDLGNGESRIFVSTQSANSIFYADVDYTQEDPFGNVKFQIVPDLDADAGFGEIRTFDVDEDSGWLYFSWWPEEESSLSSDDREPGIYRCTTEADSLIRVELESEAERGTRTRARAGTC